MMENLWNSKDSFSKLTSLMMLLKDVTIFLGKLLVAGAASLMGEEGETSWSSLAMLLGHLQFRASTGTLTGQPQG